MLKDGNVNLHNSKKMKLFDDIYRTFRKKYYLLEKVASVHKAKEIKSLLEEKRYFELYEKYGERIYKKYRKRIQKEDIIYELGKKPTFNNYLFLQQCKRVGVKLATYGLIYSILLDSMITSIMATGVVESDNNESYIQEETNKILEQYNSDIKEYADYINGLELTDLEVIVKEIDDMWSTIYGYNIDAYYGRYDNFKYFRLALYTNGYGVCRHMADDFTARINEINPEYNAYNVLVYCTGAEVNNTERYVFGEELDGDKSFAEEVIYNLLSKYIGNHMVTFLTIPGKNITLIVDPTNPSIGVLKNGKIYMLSNDESIRKSMEISRSNTGYKINNIEEFSSFYADVLKSYFSDITIDEAIEKYGIDVQNSSLEHLKSQYDSSYYKLNVKHTSGPLRDFGYGMSQYNESLIIKPYNNSSTSQLSYSCYRQINQYISSNYITEITIDCYNNDFDFSNIDFSNLDAYINFVNYDGGDIDIIINSNIKSLNLKFNNSDEEIKEFGNVNISFANPTDVQEITISAPNFRLGEQSNLLISGIDSSTRIVISDIKLEKIPFIENNNVSVQYYFEENGEKYHQILDLQNNVQKRVYSKSVSY